MRKTDFEKHRDVDMSRLLRRERLVGLFFRSVLTMLVVTIVLRFVFGASSVEACAFAFASMVLSNVLPGGKS